jgi:hypothetical protein
MVTLTNDRIEVRVTDDGADVTLVDRRRGCVWRLDAARRSVAAAVHDGTTAGRRPLGAGTVAVAGASVRVTYALPEGRLCQCWTLADDHVCVSLDTVPDVLARVALPGPFRLAGDVPSLLLPPYQGVLYRPAGYAWEDSRPGGGHGNFSLSMAALLGTRGALLVTQETIADWRGVCGEDGGGPFVYFDQDRCPVTGWPRREVRVYPVDPSIAAVAWRYRERLHERGEFVSWTEKVAERPMVANLFGALIAFIGYNRTDEVDYAAGARRLRDMGFLDVLYFPVRMCNYSLGFRMGGDLPIWLSDDEIARLKAVPGARVAPWGWFIEGLDDGSDRMHRIYRGREDGSFYNGWRIDQQQWKLVCTPYQVEESRRRFATDMAAMDWIHYDVNATRLGREAICHRRDHERHGGVPMSRADDVAWTRRLLGPETNGNRIVSSEGFVDRYATSYDIGTTKIWPACAPYADFIPVPLTMLVLHDSVIHDWWEVHNYNTLPGMGIGYNRFGTTGSGGAAKKAAMDALYGCPPSVFPFGRQYAWVDIDSRRTFSFTVRLDDREVQKALHAALPVTRLHRRIGRLPMTGFAFVTPDGAVQTTVFADGTRIVANLSDRERDAAAYGRLPANSWREVRE